MNSINLKLIMQPSWKVRIIDAVARVLGILVHVEGVPVGSSRNYARSVRGYTIREGYGEV